MTAASSPTAAAHINAGPSERAAQRRAARIAPSLEAQVHALVIAAGEQGLTAKEAREKLGLPVDRQYSVAPRLSRLKGKKLVRPTGMVRDKHMAYVAVTAADEVAA